MSAPTVAVATAEVRLGRWTIMCSNWTPLSRRTSSFERLSHLRLEGIEAAEVEEGRLDVSAALVADGMAVTPDSAFTTYEHKYSTPKGGYKFLIFNAHL
jgi:hypothetical protein